MPDGFNPRSYGDSKGSYVTWQELSKDVVGPLHSFVHDRVSEAEDRTKDSLRALDIKIEREIAALREEFRERTATALAERRQMQQQLSETQDIYIWWRGALYIVSAITGAVLAALAGWLKSEVFGG